jgi:hypothetical protein
MNASLARVGADPTIVDTSLPMCSARSATMAGQTLAAVKQARARHAADQLAQAQV